MIRIECDNCERAFEVGADEPAGSKAACPFCGDVNRVPEAHRPEARGLPPDSGPEQPICEVHPAMFRAHPFRGLALVALVAGGAILSIWSLASENLWRGWAWVGLVSVVGGLGWWVAWLVSAHYWVKLSISNKRTVRQEGIIRRHTSEVLHDHVRNVEIRQSFFQRVMNVGYLGISSSGQEGIEIEVSDLPRPYRLKALIDQYRNL
ncbi:MAG: PH domain-containing protein [Candidatus Rokubacteria bacterium]|nr:PH domain-containing protein [Candidatus Rokubacteria bacterium]